MALTPEQFRRAEAIFLEACAKPPGERFGFVDQDCAEDEELRAQVHALLRHDQEPAAAIEFSLGAALRRIGTAVLGQPAESVGLPERIGAYRILELLGEGGFGLVFLAEQDNPKRIVALKVLRTLIAGHDAVRRFQYEAQIQGRLQHPGIAQIFEAGVAQSDAERYPFFAMEYVRGRNLIHFAQAQHSTGGPLNVRQRLDLFARALDAVQHAHRHGVIHRDLKPDNILVREPDPQTAGDATCTTAIGEPKILDFGVARVLDPSQESTTLRTQVGQLFGTLAYMSPEQIAGSVEDIDTRSDLYSMGVVLFQLLTDQLPYDVQNRPLHEAARIITERDPRLLSASARALRGDLEAIVTKALQKDRSRRYSSAEAFAADIRRYLAGEPIEARRDSALYVLRKNLRRYREVVISAAVLILLLTAFGAFAAFQAARNTRLTRVALTEKNRADAEAERMRRSLYVSRIGYAQSALLHNDVARLRRLLDECPADLRGWEWSYLDRLADRSVRTLYVPDAFMGGGSLSRSERCLATNYRNGVFAVLDLPSGGELLRFHRPVNDPTGAILPDATRVIVVSEEGNAELVDVARGERIRVFSDPTLTSPEDGVAAGGLALSSDGGRLATRSRDGTFRFWAVSNGELQRQLPRVAVNLSVMSFSGDGPVFLWGETDGVIRAWDLGADREWPVSFPTGSAAESIAVSPDGQLLATGDWDAEVTLWRIETGEKLATLTGHETRVIALSFSSDGRFLASGGWDRMIRVWDVGRGDLVRVLRGHDAEVTRVWFIDGGRRLLSTSLDQTVKWWSLDTTPDVSVIHTGDTQAYSVAFSPDGRRLLTSGDGPAARVLNLDTASDPIELPGHTARAFAAAFSPDATMVATGGADRVIRLSDSRTGEQLRTYVGHGDAVFSVAFSPDGGRIVSSDVSGTCKVWEVREGEELLSLSAHQRGVVNRAYFSPDGMSIATCGQDTEVRLWDSRTGVPLRTFPGHGRGALDVAFRPNGSQLATAAADKMLRVWDVATGQVVLSCAGNRSAVHGCAYSPDGSRIATAGADHTVRVWDANTGEELLTLTDHPRMVMQVAFSPDGRILAASAVDGTVRLWESPSGPRRPSP